MEATRKGPLPARVVVREQVRLSRSSVPHWDIRVAQPYQPPPRPGVMKR